MNYCLGHTFGFHRAEVIAALVSVLTIWVLTAFLVNEAIQRIKSPQEINAKLVRKRLFFFFFEEGNEIYNIINRCVVLQPLV